MAVSVVGIAANVVLDWIAVVVLGWGAQGLVGTTSVIQILSAAALAVLLGRKGAYHSPRELLRLSGQGLVAGAASLLSGAAVYGLLLGAGGPKIAAAAAGSCACAAAFLGVCRLARWFPEVEEEAWRALRPLLPAGRSRWRAEGAT